MDRFATIMGRDGLSFAAGWQRLMELLLRPGAREEPGNRRAVERFLARPDLVPERLAAMQAEPDRYFTPVLAASGRGCTDPEAVGVMRAFDHCLDQLFGLDHDAVQAELTPGRSRGPGGDPDHRDAGLEASGLHTSWVDLYRIFKAHGPGRFLDPGTGMGRSVILHQILYPESHATGLERVAPRLESARRVLAGKAARLLVRDLLDLEELPRADLVLLYLPAGPVLQAVLAGLRRLACRQPLTVAAIESHGDLFPCLGLEEDWLRPAGRELPVSLPRHQPAIRFYTSRPVRDVQAAGRARRAFARATLDHLAVRGWLPLRGGTAAGLPMARFLGSCQDRTDLELVIASRPRRAPARLWTAPLQGCSLLPGPDGPEFHLSHPECTIALAGLRGERAVALRRLAGPPAAGSAEASRLKPDSPVRKIFLTPPDRVELRGRGLLPVAGSGFFLTGTATKPETPPIRPDGG